MNYIVSFNNEAELAHYLRAHDAVRIPSAGEMYLTITYDREGSAVHSLMRQLQTPDGLHASFTHQHEAIAVQRAA